MKRLLFAAVLAIVSAVILNTLRMRPPAAPTAGVELAQVDEGAVAQRLAGAVRIATISHASRADDDPAQLEAFAAYLQKSFPLMHARLRRETIAGHSLLYTWAGSDPKAAPILLLAHMDVVPVEPGTEARWKHPPFGGEIAEGYIWGRGALDDKGSLMQICEAVEALLAHGFVPAHDVMLAFGHDEEVGGHGAQAISALLKSRGVRAELLLDEGGMITQGVVDGVERPVASIMTAEKGYASFRLTARDAGGHSSRPPPQTAIGRLAHAVSRVQETPMPARLTAPTTDMLTALAPYMPLAQRVGLANRWLLGPVVLQSLAAKPTGNAMVRTTTAPTMFNAGVKDNVLPSEANAVINFRLLPGDSVAGVEAHIRAAVADPAIEVTAYADFNVDPSPVADTGSPSYALLKRTVNDVFPDAIVTPGLVIGATDARHYAGVYESRYNFSPSRYQPEDIERVHGTDERVSVKDYAQGVRFYLRLLKNANGG